MRVESVPTATSRISRRRCSTPISSASSASMRDGVWTKVLVVVVPSYSVILALMIARNNDPSVRTHIFDLFNGKVGVCWHANFLWLDIDDDQ